MLEMCDSEENTIQTLKLLSYHSSFEKDVFLIPLQNWMVFTMY